MRLDAGGLQAAQVLFDPRRSRRHRHFAIRGLKHRVRERGAFQVLRIQQLHDVHLRGVDRHRHLIGLRIEFREHVTCIVRQPLCRLPVVFRRERDRTAHLDDHVRHRRTYARDQLVELREALGTLAVQLADMQMQHGGTRVITIHGFLDLIVHRHRNVFREVLGHPFRTVRGDGDDNLLLVFGVQRIVEKLHVLLQLRK
ncbi:hypothetical protein AWB67_07507 [Caballeronia terrestris]|uniref:Uncharacterized protein n=1 Tax=Caballeronia terrestris TaxID=1226301 RepID=A0A158L3J6_9BURK|nr:hypothetical protein AWB67_07507 [Caballeronia terrestris]